MHRRFSSSALHAASWIATILSCFAPQLAHAQTTRERAADHASQPYVVERSRTVWRFESDGTGRKDVLARVKIQSDAAVRHFGQLVFPYNAANERLDIVSVRIEKADGSTVAASQDAVQDLSSSVGREAPVYTDLREKHVTVPSLRPGDTLEYEIVTVVHTALTPGQFWTEHEFSKTGIVLDDELEIDIPIEKHVTLKTRPGLEPSVTDRGNRRVYRWQTSRTEDDTSDRGKGTDVERKPEKPQPAAVRLTTFPDWESVGRWYGALEKPQKAPTDAVRKKALELTAGKTSDLEKVQALYEYVAASFRYVSLSFGVGRFQPHAAADVLVNQYGDCKDKHTLLASLVESVGLRASAALVNPYIDIDPDFPSPSQFNHVITRVTTNGGDIWLDTTTEVAPYRMLISTLRNKHALIVDGSASRLADTPAESPVAHGLDVRVVGTISNAGALSAHVKVTTAGDYDLFMRMLFHQVPRTEWKKMLARIVERDGLDGDISEWRISDPVALRDPFVLEWDVTTANFVTWATRQADLQLPLNDFFPMLRDGGDDDATVDIGSPRRIAYTAKLQLPDGTVRSAPVAVSIARDYGTYRADYRAAAGVFTADRLLSVTASTLAADRRDDYAAFRRVVNRDLQQKLSIESAHADAGASDTRSAADLNKNGRDAIDAGNYRHAVSLLTRVTELEPKHKSAWNDLGRAYIELNEADHAIAALRRQIEINAFDLNAYNNLGRAYVLQRRYGEAETAFRKQIEVNPLDYFAHANVGEMYLEWRKYDLASTELEKAIAISPKDATLRIRVGEAYLNQHEHDKAIDTFDRAVEIDDTPRTWNEIAYQLALHNTDLDLAKRYAESAVTTHAAASRNVSVDHVTATGVWEMRELAACWDTLGWVYLAKGDLARAERYIGASWQLDQNPEVGDHLGQVYERQGRRDDAIRMYALSLNGSRPASLIHEHLAALVGDRTDAVIQQQRGELERERTMTVETRGPAGAKADFYVLFGRDAVDVKFVSGDERLRPSADALRTMKYRSLFPDDAPANVLRRGTLACGPDSRCTFTLTPLLDAQLAEQQ